MKRLLYVGIAVLALVGTKSQLLAQKIGVVDSKAILEVMPEVQSANSKLQAMQKNWQDSVQLMQTALQSKAEAYKKVLDTMTPQAKDAANAELSQMQDNLIKYRDSKFDQQTGELTQQQQLLFKPIFDKAKDAIASVAKKEKVGVVLDKSSQVLYSEGAEDLTQKVTDFLKQAK